MQLKDYQSAAIDLFANYLHALRSERGKAEQVRALGLDVDHPWDAKGWQTVRGMARYLARKNGLGEPLPAVCFKMPTGGGKTLMAVHAVGAIQRLYLGSRTGLVLWIVPSTQIYAQTLRALRDRAHPYRQQLDLFSGGRTLIVEKTQRFRPEDVSGNLVVLLLMLPSANRLDKETLKMFQDQGGFETFFPAEDDFAAHKELLDAMPNLDVYASANGLGYRVVKTSLGNTLRRLRPVIILDEGHKAYSSIAQETLRGFNPCFILELSATPRPESNLLVSIGGRELLQEGMIKLPINVHALAGNDWRNALLAAHRKREELESLALKHQQNTGVYIRPIFLVQVERTGKKQRLPGVVHAEDVREYLIAQCAVAQEQIAVKSSQQDELEKIDLLDSQCPIRYIITRQALQEGWDCPFAYILATVINSDAPTSMTQIVGRVLRQPYARKTGVLELDESHVYYSRERTGKMIQAINQSLLNEGLADATGSILEHREGDAAPAQWSELPIRQKYKDLAGKVYLPCFVMVDGEGENRTFRQLGYEIDILSQVDFLKIDLSPLDTLSLNPPAAIHEVTRLGLKPEALEPQTLEAVVHDLDPVFVTRQLLDVVPNPWVAWRIVQESLERLRQRHDDSKIRQDLGLIIHELKRILCAGRDHQGKRAFLRLLESGQLKFWLVKGSAGAALPERIRSHSGPRLRHPDTDQTPQRSLFDYAAEDFNQTESAFALYLDEQEPILWWFRNLVKPGYSIQGWHRSRAYPDFVAGQGERADDGRFTLTTVRVLETKGLHLKNEDTAYKQELFELCNRYGQKQLWDDIAGDFANHHVHFRVVFEDEWRQVLNEMLLG